MRLQPACRSAAERRWKWCVQKCVNTFICPQNLQHVNIVSISTRDLNCGFYYYFCVSKVHMQELRECAKHIGMIVFHFIQYVLRLADHCSMITTSARCPFLFSSVMPRISLCHCLIIIDTFKWKWTWTYGQWNKYVCALRTTCAFYAGSEAHTLRYQSQLHIIFNYAIRSIGKCWQRNETSH